MRRLDPCLAPAGYSPRRYETLSPAPVLDMGERMTDLRDIQALFANGEQGGYWPADPAYAYEDSAGTIPASRDGVVGLRTNAVTGYPNAIQATTANKPYLRRTPTTGKYWYDSNTATGAMNVTFASVLGQRNLLTYSENFASMWNMGLASVTPNATISPDGAMNAWKLTENFVNALHYIQQSPSLVESTVYTKSIYAKAAERNWLVFQLRTPDGIWRIAYFNLSDGTIGSLYNVTATTVNVGNGWYRYSMTTTSPGSGVASNNESLFVASANETVSYQGDGTSGIYIWGAQLETGTTPTNYQKIVAGPSSALDPTALSATYSKNISATTNCTVACVTPEGVVIADNQTVGTTYNICPPYGYNSDVLIINRALTPAEKALVTRVMQRDIPVYGSLVNAIPQMRGYSANNEMQIDWSTKTSFIDYWRYGGNYLSSFPLINTSNGTNFDFAWYGCSSLTSFPLINTAAGTSFSYAWAGCSSLTSFPLINTAAGTSFSYAWAGCSGLTSFPLINTAAGTSFYQAWLACSGLTSFPLINTAAGTNFSYAWAYCSSLTSFPANFFDSWTGVPIANCFSLTWESCVKLTLASVQNIVVSLVVSGKSAPATGTDISLDGAPTLVAIQADTTVMTAVATLKSRNWTPKYKGTAL